MLIFLGAFMMIFLAEMGDKSQLLAFSLASCYSVKTILLGIFFGTLINNGLAIFIGSTVGGLLDMRLVVLVSAFMFLGFGLWTLFETDEEANEEEEVKCGVGSFFAVFSLFTIAEFGDKTQLASAAYAATYGAPFLTLGGVLAGMLLADALGIYLGFRLRNKVSIHKLKLASSGIFFILGGVSLFTLEITVIVKLAAIAIIIAALLWRFWSFVVSGK